MRIELPYPQAEAYARLQRVTAPADYRERPGRGLERLPLVGDVTPDGFVVRALVGYQNSFGAVCRGRLVPTPGGCRLEAQVGPPAWSLAFLLGWFVLLLYISLGRLPAGAPWSDLLSGRDGGTFVIMVAGGTLAGTLGLGLAYSEAKRIRDALARALDAPRAALDAA
jgi:hypothetical protein